MTSSNFLKILTYVPQESILDLLVPSSTQIHINNLSNDFVFLCTCSCLYIN